MDDSDLSAGRQSKISWIKVELTATRELDIQIENGLLLPPDTVRNMVLSELPHHKLALRGLRVTSVPKCYENAGDFQVGLELVTDELKANVAYRMITDKASPATTHEPITETDTDDIPNAGGPTDVQATIETLRQRYAAQIAAGSTGQHNARASRLAARNTAKKLQELRRTNDLELNNLPHKSNTTANRVKKPYLQREKKHWKRAKREEQVTQERMGVPGEPRGNAMAVHFQRLQSFTQRRGKDAITAQLEAFGRNEDSKAKELLERAVERQCMGEESGGLTEDKKVDLIADQLERLLDTGSKLADKKTCPNDKEADDMQE
ncbi:hypothetical protein PV04_10599 [Phialophora macrospora]|uniref:Uncharacterized protein n=1 Tax=Phialophora macrospora TaxID=1851006 RepID=A0A0D2F654_9EURO|nr:hypothetical protein PV04_10599 [Phialophora macrospora]